jgi:hypothetical protein
MRIPVPRQFEVQVPISLKLSCQPAGKLKKAYLERDGRGNLFLVAKLRAMAKGERVSVSWQSVVLIGEHDYRRLDEGKCFLPPAKSDSWPAEVRRWLMPTATVQCQHPDIVKRALQLKGKQTDVLKLAEAVAAHRHRLKGNGCGYQDAVTTLHNNGACTGCANLAAALLRAMGVPARVLACFPTWGTPLQTHYIVEVYVPDFGWVWLESTMGRFPWQAWGEVIVYVVTPEDENKSVLSQGCFGVPNNSLPKLSSLTLRYMGAFEDYTERKEVFHEAGGIRVLSGGPDTWKKALELTRQLWKRELAEMQEGVFNSRLQREVRGLVAQTTLDCYVKHLRALLSAAGERKQKP